MKFGILADTQIRVLPMEPISCNNGKSKFDLYTGIMWTMPPKLSVPKGVIKVPDDFDVVSKPAPLPKRLPIQARHVIGCTLPDIPYSRHRSKRVLKKLRKRLSTSLLGETLILNLPPKVIEFLTDLAKKKRKSTAPNILDQFSFIKAD